LKRRWRKRSPDSSRSSDRRPVVTTISAPAEGTDVALVIPAAALVDQAEQTAAADYEKSFPWPAGEAIVEDTVAPRLDTVCVQGDQVEIQLSEEPNLTQFQSAVTVDGLQLTCLGLATTYSETFEIATEPVDVVLFDSLRPGRLAESAISILHGFHGRPVDPETGLVYFRSRYYDPELGRFISTDPEEYGDSFGDPTGESVTPEFLWDLSSLGFGVNSLITDLKEGYYGMAAVDAFGVLVDAVAAATPFVPGGLGAVLKGCRATTSSIRRRRWTGESTRR
jgi:RHS repeat-associated protein